MRKFDRQLRAKVEQGLREFPGLPTSQLAAKLNASTSSVYSAVRTIAEDAVNTRPGANEGREIAADLNGTEGTITTRSENIKTLDAALKAANVDLNVWEVNRHVINSWEVTMGAKSAGGARAQTFTNWQVKVWLRRKPSEVRSIKNILRRGLKRAPRVALRRSKADTLLEVSLFDAHFGLLAWGRETNENYDLKIAETRFVRATDDLLAKTRGFEPGRILFPIGNDFFHIDNEAAETPRSGNRLDKDGRLCKVLEVGVRAVVHAVNQCAKVAPVDVIWIPGNHDPLMSYFLCLLLREHFAASRHIRVDTDPKPRKYVHYGANLIGFTHGCDEQHRDLPTIMAGENPREFGSVRTREFHVGHFHQRRALHFNGTDSFANVVVRVLPSLSGTDAWHFSKGYVGGTKAADAYLYDRTAGFLGHFTSSAA